MERRLPAGSLSDRCPIRYVKRLQMARDLHALPNLNELPGASYWVPWSMERIDDHALVKHRCFADELDAAIFPCLATEAGCRDLMREIAGQPGFLPEATWLIGRGLRYLGTIQAVVIRGRTAMIQNVGVVPQERGRGLGRLLVIKSLLGLKRAGLRRVLLEVTADNAPAVRLYRGLGFRRQRSFYKSVETAWTQSLCSH